ncbi:MAG TPA: hypothetical protein VND62_00050 [Acidimicrobiales bacterium]|nr:hypothetical protein [Acidimicrobiales bacterium]
MAFQPPSDLYDRESEWASLVSWATDPRPGMQVAVIWGRRRQGKSYLLRRLSNATHGLYYQAVQRTTPQSLGELGARLGDHLGVGRLAFRDWDEALSALAQLGVRHFGGYGGAAYGSAPYGGTTTDLGPAVAVIDEFPYLRSEAAELPSVIQRAVDRSVDEQGPPVRLILCGSALSVMTELLAPRSPLHGRISMQLLVNPFDHLTAAAFWGIDDPRLALRVIAVVGGTPAYRDLARSRPASLADFDRWIVEGVLDPSSALFRDDEVLVAEGLEVSNRTIYQSVLSAVASGECTQSKIASAIGRTVNATQFSLDNLVRAGFLTKDEDAIRQRRPVYSVSDPLIRFHRAIRDPDAARFEDGQGAAAWRDADPRFRSAALGPTWEGLVRKHVRRRAEELFGEPAKDVGRTAVPNQERRVEEEVDVVALGSGSGPKRKVVRCLGEAKLRELGVGDLIRLEGIAQRIASASVRVAEPCYVLASASGFSKELIRGTRARHDVKLVSLDDVYAP